MPAAMSDPLATSVPRLDPTGSNWAIFAMRFQEAMEANQKWKHFTGTPGRPTPADASKLTDEETKAIADWDHDEVVSRYLLSQRLPDSTAVRLKGLTTAKERSFSEMRCPRGGDVRSFLGSMRVKREELAAVGVTMSPPVSSNPPLPLTPTSSSTTSPRRPIGCLRGASGTVVPLAKASSLSPKVRTRRWQQRRGRAGRRNARGSATTVASRATGPASAGHRRKTSSLTTKISSRRGSLVSHRLTKNSTKAENKPVGSANAVDDEPDGCWSAVFVGDVLESEAPVPTPQQCEEAGASAVSSGGLAAAAITQVEESKSTRVELVPLTPRSI